MCLTPIVDYVPRPVKPAERPDGAPPSLAEVDSNLYGPKPTPPGWEVETKQPISDDSRTHPTSEAGSMTGVAAFATAVATAETTPTGSRLESMMIELPSGRRLLITEL